MSDLSLRPARWRHPYRWPMLSVVLVVIGALWWGMGEESRALERTTAQARLHITSLAQGLSIVQTHLGEDVDERLGRHVREHLMLGPSIEFIVITRGERVLVQIGDDVPSSLHLGYHPARDLFVMRKPLDTRRGRRRLCEDGALRAVRRGQSWRWIDCTRPIEHQRPSLDLYAGVSAGRSLAQRMHTKRRTLWWILIVCTGTIFFAVAWARAIRNRSLHEAFEVEHKKRLQLEDMNLAAAGVAHETMNPLGIILGLSQRLERDASSFDDLAHVQEMARHIADEADRASSRLSDFLNFASLKEPALTSVALEPLCRHVVHVLTPDFDAQQVALACEVQAVHVECDASMMEQVLVNLLLNSLRASGAHTTTTIRATCQGHRVSLSVEDQGAGIVPERLEHVFKPYVTYDEHGHGLGLAIVRRIAIQHNWSIGVQSSEVGTTITLDSLTLSPQGSS